MIQLISSVSINKFFKMLNENEFEYILLRNIDNELPFKLENGKDIDILIKYENFYKFQHLLIRNQFVEKPHPHRSDMFLYGARKFKFYRNKENVLIDVNFQLMCRSLDAGQWIPLDIVIQRSAWKNRRHVNFNGFDCWMLGYEDEFISLIVRSVFDKSEFQLGYKQRIIELIDLIDKNEVRKKMKRVFFSYTNTLLRMIYRHAFDDILNNYLIFKEY